MHYWGDVEALEQVVRRIVDAPSLEVLKTCFDGVLSSLVRWRMSLVGQGSRD